MVFCAAVDAPLNRGRRRLRGESARDQPREMRAHPRRRHQNYQRAACARRAREIVPRDRGVRSPWSKS